MIEVAIANTLCTIHSIARNHSAAGPNPGKSTPSSGTRSPEATTV